MIEQNYIINHNTLAIVSVRHHAYSSKVYEMHQTLYVKEPPNRIIKNAFERNFQSIDDHRKLIERTYGYEQRKPVQFGLHIPFFFFPTTGDRNPNISWLAARYINSYTGYEKDGMNYTDVTFVDGTIISIKGVSQHTINKQYKRTQKMMKLFEARILEERQTYFSVQEHISTINNKTTFPSDPYTYVPNHYQVIYPNHE